LSALSPWRRPGVAVPKIEGLALQGLKEGSKALLIDHSAQSTAALKPTHSLVELGRDRFDGGHNSIQSGQEPVDRVEKVRRNGDDGHGSLLGVLAGDPGRGALRRPGGAAPGTVAHPGAVAALALERARVDGNGPRPAWRDIESTWSRIGARIGAGARVVAGARRGTCDDVRIVLNEAFR
jgi:hypothetical protein